MEFLNLRTCLLWFLLQVLECGVWSVCTEIFNSSTDTSYR